MLDYFCILTIDANSRRSNIGASSVASAPVAGAELQSGSRHCGKSATESERIVAPTLLHLRKISREVSRPMISIEESSLGLAR